MKVKILFNLKKLNTKCVLMSSIKCTDTNFKNKFRFSRKWSSSPTLRVCFEFLLQNQYKSIDKNNSNGVFHHTMISVKSVSRSSSYLRRTAVKLSNNSSCCCFRLLRSPPYWRVKSESCRWKTAMMMCSIRFVLSIETCIATRGSVWTSSRATAAAPRLHHRLLLLILIVVRFKLFRLM